MDFRLCTLCLVAIGLFLMVDQLKAEEQTSEATETEPQEATQTGSNYEEKKRGKIKKNFKSEKTYHLDGTNKKKVKQFDDKIDFNKAKRKYKDQRSPKKESKYAFEKIKVDENMDSNGYTETWDIQNDKRNMKQLKNTKVRKYKFSDDQSVDVMRQNEKQGKKRSREESSEYENQVKEVKNYNCIGGKKHKKGRRSLGDEMQICNSCGSNGKHSKYMKKMNNKNDNFENSCENLDEQSVPNNSENYETEENTEDKLRRRNGRKIKRTYVVEDEYEAETNEGNTVEDDEDEDVALYNSDENELSQSKGKVRRYIVEEEFIEDSSTDE